MKYDRITIDLAKNVFQAGLVKGSKVVSNRKLTRSKLIELLSQCEPTEVVMEACGSAHYWARKCQEFGHQPALLPPQHVKPFRRGNKNDANDVIAIHEAADRDHILRVPVKTADQQAAQMWLRRRDLLVAQRTQICNQVRGFAAELGLIAPRGRKVLLRTLPQWLEDAENGLPDLARDCLAELYADLLDLDQRCAAVDLRIRQWADNNTLCQLLQTIRGIGPIIAAALVTAIGNGSGFKNGRNVSTWLGLVPGHSSSGEKHVELGITKRGNPTLRRLLVQGARSALQTIGDRDDDVSQWAREVSKRRGKHKAAVALANKMARMAWAVLQSGQPYRYA